MHFGPGQTTNMTSLCTNAAPRADPVEPQCLAFSIADSDFLPYQKIGDNLQYMVNNLRWRRHAHLRVPSMPQMLHEAYRMKWK